MAPHYARVLAERHAAARGRQQQWDTERAQWQQTHATAVAHAAQLEQQVRQREKNNNK